MTEEKLEQAKKLSEEITQLRKHVMYVKTTKSDAYQNVNARIYAEPDPSASRRELHNYLLPISLPEFMEMYLSKVEKHIKKLTKEFESL